MRDSCRKISNQLTHLSGHVLRPHHVTQHTVIFRVREAANVVVVALLLGVRYNSNTIRRRVVPAVVSGSRGGAHPATVVVRCEGSVDVHGFVTCLSLLPEKRRKVQEARPKTEEDGWRYFYYNNGCGTGSLGAAE